MASSSRERLVEGLSKIRLEGGESLIGSGLIWSDVEGRDFREVVGERAGFLERWSGTGVAPGQVVSRDW